MTIAWNGGCSEEKKNRSELKGRKESTFCVLILLTLTGNSMTGKRTFIYHLFFAFPNLHAAQETVARVEHAVPSDGRRVNVQPHELGAGVKRRDRIE